MSIDAHIKIDGIPGESVHKDHKDEIAVQSWNWDVANESSVGAGGGSGKGKARPGNFTFTHVYSKASPVLAKSCASGKHIKNAVLTCRKAGEGQKDFLKVTLDKVMITSVRPSAMSGGDIAEIITMSYEDIEFDYKQQDNKGELGGSVKFGWNIPTTETR